MDICRQIYHYVDRAKEGWFLRTWFLEPLDQGASFFRWTQATFEFQNDFVDGVSVRKQINIREIPSAYRGALIKGNIQEIDIKRSSQSLLLGLAAFVEAKVIRLRDTATDQTWTEMRARNVRNKNVRSVIEMIAFKESFLQPVQTPTLRRCVNEPETFRQQIASDRSCSIEDAKSAIHAVCYGGSTRSEPVALKELQSEVRRVLHKACLVDAYIQGLFDAARGDGGNFFGRFVSSIVSRLEAHAMKLMTTFVSRDASPALEVVGVAGDALFVKSNEFLNEVQVRNVQQGITNFIRTKTARISSLGTWETDSQSRFQGIEITVRISKLDRTIEQAHSIDVTRAAVRVEASAATQQQFSQEQRATQATQSTPVSFGPDRQLLELPVDAANDISHYILETQTRYTDDKGRFKFPPGEKINFVIQLMTIINEYGYLYKFEGKFRKLFLARNVHSIPGIGHPFYFSVQLDEDDLLQDRVFRLIDCGFSDILERFMRFLDWNVLKMELGLYNHGLNQEITEALYGRKGGQFVPDDLIFPRISLFGNSVTKYMHVFLDGVLWTMRTEDNQSCWVEYDEELGRDAQINLPNYQFFTWAQADEKFGRDRLQFPYEAMFNVRFEDVNSTLLENAKDVLGVFGVLWPLSTIVFSQFFQKQLQEMRTDNPGSTDPVSFNCEDHRHMRLLEDMEDGRFGEILDGYSFFAGILGQMFMYQTVPRIVVMYGQRQCGKSILYGFVQRAMGFYETATINGNRSDFMWSILESPLAPYARPDKKKFIGNPDGQGRNPIVPQTQQGALLSLSSSDRQVNVERKNCQNYAMQWHGSIMACMNSHDGMPFGERFTGANPDAVSDRCVVFHMPVSMSACEKNDQRDSSLEYELKQDDFLRAAIFIFCLQMGKELGQKHPTSHPDIPKVWLEMKEVFVSEFETENPISRWFEQCVIKQTDSYMTVSQLLESNVQSFKVWVKHSDKAAEKIRQDKFIAYLTRLVDTGSIKSQMWACKHCQTDYSYKADGKHTFGVLELFIVFDILVLQIKGDKLEG